MDSIQSEIYSKSKPGVLFDFWQGKCLYQRFLGISSLPGVKLSQFLNIKKAIMIRVYRGSTCRSDDFLQFVKKTRYENSKHKPRNEANQKLPTTISCNGCVSDDSGPHNYTLKIPIHQLENFIKTNSQNNHICVTLRNWLKSCHTVCPYAQNLASSHKIDLKRPT